MIVELNHGTLKINVYSSHFNQTAAPKTSIEAQLNQSEYLLLLTLFSNMGQHMTKHQLKLTGWPNTMVCDNSLNMAIMTLRNKLYELGNFWEISTIYRVGYSLNIHSDYKRVNIETNLFLGNSSKEINPSVTDFLTF
ncbi:helix-turn-helix domain-containing protein [Vibrio sp. YMD68]|uniref:helix-turn-helix domain-containing protein n=1 Tax=Vibrio sp. YMD68 TaxID=3042300 RepID=UPI00249C8D0D|nr:helix-turn-helix domain-containing protein [Vibrio sp. YMD68]WGV98023.1 helix-turn-helix domain-containing protein [Vibrio sp. YMD68]